MASLLVMKQWIYSRVYNMTTLNDLLIKKYRCFNTERFYLDVQNEEEGYISVVSSSISDTCPLKLCRGIAKFIKNNVDASKYNFIYVGAWAFNVKEL